MLKKWMAMLLVCVLALGMMGPAAFAQESFGATLPPDTYEKMETLRYPVVYILPESGKGEDTSGLMELLNRTGMDLMIVEVNVPEGKTPAEALAYMVEKTDSGYRTIADPAHRVLIGTGVGGYLAYALGLDGEFGMVASIRGNFGAQDNPWYETYGDISAKIQEMGADAFNNIYTYIDAPTDDGWTDLPGSTNDIGKMFIEFGTSAENHEFSARPGVFDNDFMNESAVRVADRIAGRMLSGVATGTVSFSDAQFDGKNAAFGVDYEISVGEGIELFGGMAAVEEVLVTIVDPQGNVLAETAEKKTNFDTTISSEGTRFDVTVEDTADAVLSVRILGKKIELARATIVRSTGAVIDGDVQSIDLSGDWLFSYEGMNLLDAAALNGESCAEWSVVQPGLGNWTKGYGNISGDNVNAGMAGDEYFDFMITGSGYYVKTFDVPAEFDAQDLTLSVGYVDDRCEVFLNGTKVGSTGLDEKGQPNGETTWAEYSAFKIDPALLVRGGENTVVVRAWNDMPFGAGGWYAGPIGLYSDAALNGGGSSGGSERLIETSFTSEYAGKALGAGGAIENEMLVYLPESYGEGEKRYPVMYLLHQFNSDHTSYKADAIDKLLDEGAASGAFDEMIVVIPNSDENSWWAGDWEKMLTEELVPLIDAQYRTIPDARYRLTAGCSMGGQGAYSVAMHNPGVFSGAVSFFGAFSFGGANSPNEIAAAESAEYMDYFTMAFICGNQDSYGFGAPAIDLHKQLKALGVEHFYLIDNGGHDSAFYVPRFDATVGYVCANMFHDDGAAASFVSGSFVADGNTVRAEIAADEAIAAYCNAVPASSYMEETAQAITVPVTVTAEKDSEIVEQQTQFVKIGENSLTHALDFALEGDITGCAITVSANVFETAVAIGE